MNFLDRAPEIFEWAVWRTLLSINNISCQPNQTRFFEVDLNDEDLLPLKDAAPGYEDLYFQFENYNLVVEVTYTSLQDKTQQKDIQSGTLCKKEKKIEQKRCLCFIYSSKYRFKHLQSFNSDYYYKARNEAKEGNILIIKLYR